MPFALNDPTQTSPEIHIEDVGTNFLVTIYDQNSQIVNLETATSFVIRFGKPDGSSFDKTAILYTDGLDGKVVYALESGDIDMSGRWSYQIIVSFEDTLFHTNVQDFVVYKNIEL